MRGGRSMVVSLFIYRFLLYPLFLASMGAAGIVSSKVREGIRARTRRRDVAAAGAGDDDRFRVLVHAASVGEFEQARPLIESLQTRPGGCHITASFFSPSGYTQQAHVGVLDAVEYLPLDRRGDVRAFLGRTRPDLIVVVRYDLWPVFVDEAHRRGVPVVLVCAVLRRSSRRFLPGLRGLFGGTYRRLAVAHCVGPADARAIGELAPGVAVEITGDTRYDRVLERAKMVDPTTLPIGRPSTADVVLVAGSTWPEDERLLAEARDESSLAMIIVPHEPTAEHIEGLRRRFPGALTLSEVETRGGGWDGVVIVDRTGALMALYSLADIAYVGGAHGAGVHSVLEPAAYAVPVISGPRVDRSRDAAEMRDLGLLTVTRTSADLRAALRRYADGAQRDRAAVELTSYVTSRSGATPRIIESLERRGLLNRRRVGPDAVSSEPGV